MSSSTPDTFTPSPADFFDGFFKARAGLTSPGAPFELVDSADAQGHPLKAFKNAFPHLPALLNAGRAHGPKEFIVQDGERWSFERFFAAADALAGHLHGDGAAAARCGDRLSLQYARDRGRKGQCLPGEQCVSSGDCHFCLQLVNFQVTIFEL